MRQVAGFVLLLLALLTLSCGNKKHDVAYYEQMVDSIRRAEQVKAIQKQAGIYDILLKPGSIRCVCTRCLSNRQEMMSRVLVIMC